MTNKIVAMVEPVQEAHNPVFENKFLYFISLLLTTVFVCIATTHFIYQHGIQFLTKFKKSVKFIILFLFIVILPDFVT